MGLFDFVKQHHRIGLAPDFLGQLTGIVVAHISGRRSDNPRYRMLLHEFGHIQPDQRFGRVKKLVCQCFHQFGLSHACGTGKDEGYRFLLVGNSGTASLDGTHHGVHRFVLPHDLFLDPGTQLVDLFILHFGDAGGGDPRPELDHPGQFLCRQHHLVLFCLQSIQLFAQSELFLFVFSQGPVFFFGFLFPVCALRFDLFPFLFELVQVLLGFLQVLQAGRMNRKERPCLVQQVDCLVGQIPVCNIPLRQSDRPHKNRIGNADPMEIFVPILDALQNLIGRLNAGLLHDDRLEAALQCRILFDILPVFGKGRGTDHLNFSPAEGRLQDVGGVHASLGIPRTHNGVHLVNNQNYIAQGPHFVDQSFDSRLKLSSELGAGHKGGQIQKLNLLILQLVGHLPRHDPLSKSFGNGRFAHTRFTDQTGIVLLMAAENLHKTGKLPVSADDPTQFPLPGFIGQISAVQRQILPLLILFPFLLVGGRSLGFGRRPFLGSL